MPSSPLCPVCGKALVANCLLNKRWLIGVMKEWFLTCVMVAFWSILDTSPTEIGWKMLRGEETFKGEVLIEDWNECLHLIVCTKPANLLYSFR